MAARYGSASGCLRLPVGGQPPPAHLPPNTSAAHLNRLEAVTAWGPSNLYEEAGAGGGQECVCACVGGGAKGKELSREPVSPGRQQQSSSHRLAIAAAEACAWHGGGAVRCVVNQAERRPLPGSNTPPATILPPRLPPPSRHSAPAKGVPRGVVLPVAEVAPPAHGRVHNAPLPGEVLRLLRARLVEPGLLRAGGSC